MTNYDAKMHNDLYTKALAAVLNNVGNLISIYLNDHDLARVKTFKGHVDRIFQEANKAFNEQQKKKKATQLN